MDGGSRLTKRSKAFLVKSSLSIPVAYVSDHAGSASGLTGTGHAFKENQSCLLRISFTSTPSSSAFQRARGICRDIKAYLRKSIPHAHRNCYVAENADVVEFWCSSFHVSLILAKGLHISPHSTPCPKHMHGRSGLDKKHEKRALCLRKAVDLNSLKVWVGWPFGMLHTMQRSGASDS